MTSSAPEMIPPASPDRAGFARRHWVGLTFLVIVVGPALIFTIWSGLALNYTYSSGERAGYVQKLSKKGWICKTWEGELQISSIPGSMPQLFTFSVRSDSVAAAINEAMAKGRVVLYYEQHIGVPTSCFGETEYFVKRVQSVGGA